MAFDPHPSTWLGSGYTLSSHVVGMQTNDASSNKTLTQLTDTQANASTGDIRAVMFAIVEKFYQAWVAQAGSQPVKMQIGRTIAANSDGTQQYNYNFSFVVTPPTGAYTLTAE